MISLDDSHMGEPYLAATVGASAIYAKLSLEHVQSSLRPGYPLPAAGL